MRHEIDEGNWFLLVRESGSLPGPSKKASSVKEAELLLLAQEAEWV
jgi:hypothetical protein